MRRRDFLLAAGAVTLGWGAAARPRHPAGARRQRGVSFDAFRASPTHDDFRAIRSVGATHVSFAPFGWMASPGDPRVRRVRRSNPGRSRSDDRLSAMARMARDAGLQVFIIPTIGNFRNGQWRGDIRMSDEESWAAWFDSYRAFLLHYAALAADVDAAGLSVGTELADTTHRETQWRTLIDAIRPHFGGWLTYAANWDDYGEVAWWDAVDFLGVQAYFELGTPPSELDMSDRLAFLLRKWEPITRDLGTVSARFGRSVLFTEIGYKSHVGSTARPWQWRVDGERDVGIQAAAYEAALRALWREPWFEGLYWWKWHPASGPARDRSRDFTPQGKPAEEVLRRWWRVG